MKNKRIVFMGTPLFSVPLLEMLIENTNVVLVVTQPDREVGRKREIKFSPVKQVALKHNIEVFQPVKIRDDFECIKELNPDLIVTCAFGQILPKELLEIPKYGCINAHISLLPKLRGGAPIQKAIIYGEKSTGTTIMFMAEGMDDGDIIKQSEIDILETDTYKTLHDKLQINARDLLLETLPKIFEGSSSRTPQDHSKATFAYAIKREEELLDFNKSAKEVYNHIRGLNPVPLSYTTLDGEIIKIIESKIGSETRGKAGEIISLYPDGFGVKCGDRELIITKLKPSGKNEMKASDFINGRKDNLLGKVLC